MREGTRTHLTESEVKLFGSIENKDAMSFTLANERSPCEITLGRRGEKATMEIKFRTAQDKNTKTLKKRSPDHEPRNVKLKDFIKTERIKHAELNVQLHGMRMSFEEEQLIALHAWIGSLIKTSRW